jgi:D-alanine-D-alanine ligase
VTLRVLHLVGSAVSDFFCDLSRLYARDCLEATDDRGRYEPVIAYVTPGGRIGGCSTCSRSRTSAIRLM